jgi:hypothetical protein
MGTDFTDTTSVKSVPIRGSLAHSTTPLLGGFAPCVASCLELLPKVMSGLRRIPKGFHPPAQGCEERATLGSRPQRINPEVGCIKFPPPIGSDFWHPLSLRPRRPAARLFPHHAPPLEGSCPAASGPHLLSITLLPIRGSLFLVFPNEHRIFLKDLSDPQGAPRSLRAKFARLAHSLERRRQALSCFAFPPAQTPSHFPPPTESCLPPALISRPAQAAPADCPHRNHTALSHQLQKPRTDDQTGPSCLHAQKLQKPPTPIQYALSQTLASAPFLCAASREILLSLRFETIRKLH